LLLLLGVLLLGNYLREYSYATVPHPGETADEYGFAWAGLSLIEKGIPESWTTLGNIYPKIESKIINVDNLYDKNVIRIPFTMVEPWFEKPPLFPLLIGGYSYLKNARLYAQTSTGIIRRPMLKIAILTSILIFWLASRWYGYGVGLLSVFLYSIIPTFVISSRLAISENGYTPLYLASLISIDYFLANKKRIYLIISALLAGIGILVKIPAVVIMISLIFILLKRVRLKNNLRNILLISIVGFSGFLLFAVYGYFLGWGTFVKVFLTQNRYFYGAGSESFFSVLVQSKVAIKNLTDGWILLGWMAAFYIAVTEWKNNRGGTILSICLFSYLIVFLYFGNEAYGWYRFPFFPFLAIALAKVFKELWEKRNLYVFTILSLLPFGTGFQRIFGQLGFQPIVIYFRLAILFLALLFFVRLVTKGRWINRVERVAMVLVFSLLVYISIREIIFLNYDHWFFVT